MNIKLVLSFAFLCTTLVQAKILIFTYAYNRPEFIEYQHLTFQKFMLDEYEFVVFNDARNHVIAKNIEDMCKKYGLRCIRIPQEIHNRPYLQRWPGEDYNHPSARNSNVVQYSLNEYGFDFPGIVMLLDSDMFLIKEFSLEKYMKDYQLVGLPQSRMNPRTKRPIEYLWIGLVFLDMQQLPNKRTLNFNCGRIEGVPVDAGGYTHYYIKNHPQVVIGHMECPAIDDESQSEPVRWMARKLLENGLNNNWEFLLNAFFHYRGGTNWDNQTTNYHAKKWSIVKNLMNTLLTK